MPQPEKEYIDDESITFGTDRIHIRRDKSEGKGVYAKENIKANDLIERFSMMPLHFRTMYQPDMSIMRNVIVKENCPCEECKKHGYSMYLPQGYATCYRYADDSMANAEFKYNHEKYYGLVLAKKDINKGEEIITPSDQSYHFRNYVLPQLQLNQLRDTQNETRS